MKIYTKIVLDNKNKVIEENTLIIRDPWRLLGFTTILNRPAGRK